MYEISLTVPKPYNLLFNDITVAWWNTCSTCLVETAIFINMQLSGFSRNKRLNFA